MGKTLTRVPKGKGQRQKAASTGWRTAGIAGIIAAVLAAVLGLGYLAMSASTPRGPDGLLAPGAQAPGFSLARLGGSGSISLTDYKGKVVVLNFWYSQ